MFNILDELNPIQNEYYIEYKIINTWSISIDRTLSNEEISLLEDNGYILEEFDDSRLVYYFISK